METLVFRPGLKATEAKTTRLSTPDTGATPWPVRRVLTLQGKWATAHIPPSCDGKCECGATKLSPVQKPQAPKVAAAPKDPIATWDKLLGFLTRDGMTRAEAVREIVKDKDFHARYLQAVNQRRQTP